MIRFKKERIKVEMLKKIIVPACLVLFCAFPSVAAAAGQNYIVAKLGAYSPQSNDLSGYSSDFAGELAAGHYFNSNFAAEFGVGHLQTSGTVLVSNRNIFFAQEDIDATFLEATAKVVFPVPYYYSPTYYSPAYMDFYAGAGVGVYFANDNVDAIGFSRSDTVGGFHILGGVDFNINRDFFLGFEAKYLWAKPFDTNLDGLIFTGNFGYRF